MFLVMIAVECCLCRCETTCELDGALTGDGGATSTPPEPRVVAYLGSFQGNVRQAGSRQRVRQTTVLQSDSRAVSNCELCLK